MVQPGYYIRYEVYGTFEDIFETLRPRFGNISHHLNEQEEHSEWGVLLGSQFFLITESEVAIAIVIHSRPDCVILEVTGYAGGSELALEESDVHRDIAEQVAKTLEEHGFKFQIQLAGALG